LIKAAQAGWPVVSQIVGLVVRDEMSQRDRFMRENLDALAQRVGEMQAKLVKLEAVGERVAGLAGVKADEARLRTSAPSPASAAPKVDAPAVPATPAAERRTQNVMPVPMHGQRGTAGQGGPFVPAPAQPGNLAELDLLIQQVEQRAESYGDLFVLIESRLLERRLSGLLVPSTAPVDGPTSSGFGFRADPISGRAALHTGLDFPADVGTPILAAAGGVVLSDETHPAYGRMLEVDHGRGLITRYAHASRLLVKAGDIVRRGQTIAEVGNSGRSTGPHLHFEVLVDGVPQDPAKFLAGAPATPKGPGDFAARPAVMGSAATAASLAATREGRRDAPR
jgi:murein DD-endopeptidase MepM/ murein hydrolase activator NlpD